MDSASNRGVEEILESLSLQTQAILRLQEPPYQFGEKVAEGHVRRRANAEKLLKYIQDVFLLLSCDANISIVSLPVLKKEINSADIVQVSVDEPWFKLVAVYSFRRKDKWLLYVSTRSL